jgi:hypothetical protein
LAFYEDFQRPAGEGGRTRQRGGSSERWEGGGRVRKWLGLLNCRLPTCQESWMLVAWHASPRSVPIAGAMHLNCTGSVV